MKRGLYLAATGYHYVLVVKTAVRTVATLPNEEEITDAFGGSPKRLFVTKKRLRSLRRDTYCTNDAKELMLLLGFTL